MAPLGKLKAVISYLTFIGLFIAISMNKDERHDFATWHIKNMFGLTILFFVAFAMSYQEYLLSPGKYIFLGTLFFWVYSFIGALLNRKSGVPFLSAKFQDWFKFLN